MAAQASLRSSRQAISTRSARVERGRREWQREAMVRPRRFTQAMSTAPLLQFKAGRAFRQGATNTVVAQPDRGCVSSSVLNLVVVADPQLVILLFPATLAPVPPAEHDDSPSITRTTSQWRPLVLPSSRHRPSQPRLPPERGRPSAFLLQGPRIWVRRTIANY